MTGGLAIYPESIATMGTSLFGNLSPFMTGGGKKRRKRKGTKRKKLSKRRTRRTKGKRTRRCNCKTCKCNPCKCTKRSSRSRRSLRTKRTKRSRRMRGGTDDEPGGAAAPRRHRRGRGQEEKQGDEGDEEAKLTRDQQSDIYKAKIVREAEARVAKIKGSHDASYEDVDRAMALEAEARAKILSKGGPTARQREQMEERRARELLARSSWERENS